MLLYLIYLRKICNLHEKFDYEISIQNSTAYREQLKSDHCTYYRGELLIDKFPGAYQTCITFRKTKCSG